jgi:hypothetical protein
MGAAEINGSDIQAFPAAKIEEKIRDSLYKRLRFNPNYGDWR